MPKVAMIGAGSATFASRLIGDMLTYPDLAGDVTLSLVDVDHERLAITEAWAHRAAEQTGGGMCVLSPESRREALDDADYVIVMVMIGGVRPYQVDIQVPMGVGVNQTVGDTLGPGGVFRGLRTVPFLIELCHEMEELCPNALLLNYANPMAINCWAMNFATNIKNVGLCHSVQGTASQLAGYCGIPADEVTYWTAGINHMAWYLKFEHNGEDAYPLIRRASEDPGIVAKDPVRFDILRHFDYFVTESSSHMSEYVPYYRTSSDRIREYMPCRWDYPNFWPLKRETSRTEIQEQVRRYDEASEPLVLTRSAEYGIQIMHAIETGTPIRINGNVENTGLITNLPDGCCVEVPTTVDDTGLHPCHVGALPLQLAGLNRSNISVQQLAVEAALETSRRKAMQAIMLDPLTSSILPLRAIEAMVDEMFANQAEQLAAFGP